ncbi:hypothetical protein ACHAWF_003839 [Thalassiosira exigua]
MDEIDRASKRLRLARERDESAYRRVASDLDRLASDVAKRRASLDRRRDAAAEVHGDRSASVDDWIEVNAGGTFVSARRGTLCHIEGSRLASLFGGRWDGKIQRDSDGRFFLDVDGSSFRAVVDYLNELAISDPGDPPAFPTDDEEERRAAGGGGDDRRVRDRLLRFLLTPHPEFDSSIVEDPDRVALLRRWLSEDGSGGGGRLRLLYRASRDGRSSFDFHSECDDRGPTLTVVETTDGLVVGGYSTADWEVPPAAPARTGRRARGSFLFALAADGSTSPCASPRKMKLKDPSDPMATCHGGRGCGPGFGLDASARDGDSARSCDFLVRDSLLFLRSEFRSYETCPGWDRAGLSGAYDIKEMEVFGVEELSGGANSDAKDADRDAGTSSLEMEETTDFTKDVNDALNAKLRAIKEAGEQITQLEARFEDEEKFVDSFATGETKDVVTLNVSGTIVATKRSTLMAFEESALARQFDDSRWTGQGRTRRRVRDWTPDDVSAWARNLDDVSDDVATLFSTNQITGNELLAIDRDGLTRLGVARPGTLCLLSKEIDDLRKDGRNVAEPIEHGPYCFGKLLEFLRAHRLHARGLGDAPDQPPAVRESERCRFEKVVRYFFPGRCAEAVLGIGTPITIAMARGASVVDSGCNRALKDALKDGRPLRTVTLVAAVRSCEVSSNDEFVIDVEDGTGSMQAEVRFNEGGQSAQERMLSEVCKEQTYVRIIGQLEDFGGQRRILATDVRSLSSGNELTDHFLDVKQSYDKHQETQRQDPTMRGVGIAAGSTRLNNGSPGRNILMPSRMLPIGLFFERLHAAVMEILQNNGADSDSGVSVEDIVRNVSPLGFSAGEVRHAMIHLSNEGHIYSTIDEDHYQCAF